MRPIDIALKNGHDRITISSIREPYNMGFFSVEKGSISLFIANSSRMNS
jgi:hypothetical protein